MDPENERDISRLKSGIEYSLRRLEKFRTNRLNVIKQMVGKHYAEGGTDVKVALPLIRMAATIHNRRLIPADPGYLISTKYPELKQKALIGEICLNDTVKAMQLGDILRRAVLDAWIGYGVVKVGVCLYDTISWNGANHKLGQNYVELVDPEDYFVDMTAKRRELRAYDGHKYRIPLRAAQDMFPGKEVLPLEPGQANLSGDRSVSSISNPQAMYEGEIEEMTNLFEIFLPRDKLKLTMAGDQDGGVSTRVLKVAPWKGPADGDLHVLGFLDVPGQIMPAGPAQDMIDLHETINRLYLKLEDQAMRQQSNGVYRPTSGVDAETWKNSKDGQWIACDSPEDCQEISRGGPHRDNLAFTLQLKMLFGEFGGNLGALGGTGPQSSTLGQDEMIQQNSSMLIQEMQHRVLRFAGSVGNSLFEWWWTDPMAEYMAERNYPGTTIPMQPWARTLKPSDRAGIFRRLNFDVDAYSLQPKTPQAKLQAIMQLFQTLLLPAAPMMKEQNVQIPWEAAIRLICKYANISDVEQIVQFAEPPTTQNGPYQQPPRNEGGGGQGEPTCG